MVLPTRLRPTTEKRAMRMRITGEKCAPRRRDPAHVELHATGNLCDMFGQSETASGTLAAPGMGPGVATKKEMTSLGPHRSGPRGPLPAKNLDGRYRARSRSTQSVIDSQRRGERLIDLACA